MAQLGRAALKLYYETGDIPTEAQFGDLIDSLYNFTDDGTLTDLFQDGGEAGGADRSLGNTDNFGLDLLTNNQARIQITNAGYVGIGRSPQGKLHVEQNGQAEICVFSKIQPVDDGGAYNIFKAGTAGTTVRGYFGFKENGSGPATIFTYGNSDAMALRAENDLYLGAGGDNIRLAILSNGNTGIGTMAPTSALEIVSTTGTIIVARMTTGQRDALTAVNGMILYNLSTNAFNFYENGAWVTK